MKPLKAVLLVGRDIYISEEMIELYRKDGYLLIGDGKRLLTEGEISKEIADHGGIDANTRIDINAHGGNRKGSHFIDLVSDLSLFGKNVTTSEIIFDLSSLAAGVPLNIHLWSCYAGVAPKEAVNVLPAGSIVMGHAPKDAFRYGSEELFSSIRNLQSFESKRGARLVLSELANQLLLAGSQSLTFAIKLKNGTVKSFTFEPALDEILKSNSINGYLKDCFDKVKAELVAIQEEGNLPDNFLPLPERAPFFSGEQIKEFIANNFMHKTRVKFHDAPLIRSAIEAGLDVNIRDSLGTTPLIDASSRANLDAVDMLIKAGAGLDVRDSDGWTPLTLAVNNGNLKLMEKLIKAGAGLDVRDSDGWSPAMYAIHKGNIEVIDMLANARAASLVAAAGSKRRREDHIAPAEKRKRLAGLASLRGALDAIRRAKPVPERKKKKGISKF